MELFVSRDMWHLSTSWKCIGQFLDFKLENTFTFDILRSELLGVLYSS